MATTMPTSYDVLDGDVVDFIVLTLNGAHNNSTTTMTFNESIASLNYDCYLVFQEEEAGEFEIVQATGTPGANQLTVVRGYGGTDAGDYEGDEQCVLENQVAYITKIREMLVAAQKFKGLVGADASKPGTCSVGEAYIATDTSKVYLCFTTNNWTDITSDTAHSDYSVVDDADEHALYHDDGRADSWHSGLSGEHITNPTDHAHTGGATDGDPVARLIASDTLPGSVQNIGDVYLKTDENTLYISINGSDWTAYVSVPKGTMLFFESACPSGWSAKTAWDGDFLRGALISSFPLGSGGSNPHIHSLDQVVSHSHTTGNRNVSAPQSNAHPHTLYSIGGSGGSTVFIGGTTSVGSLGTTSAGSHGHSFTAGAQTSGNAGSGSPVSDSGANLPEYKSLLLCEKN